MSEKENSYKHILKAIGLFGSSQLVQILTGIIRTKVIAVVLGAAGFGLISVLQNLVQIFTTSGVLGFDTGSVRAIAIERNNPNNAFRHTVAVTKTWFLSLALIASLVCLILCKPISLWAFDDKSYALQIAFLSICVLFTILSKGYYTILQGSNQVSSMVKVSIFGNVLSLILSIPLYIIFGTKGIVPSLIIFSVLQFIFAWRYVSFMRIEAVKLPLREAWNSGKKTLRFGIAIMISSLVNTLTMFLLRIYIIDEMDLTAAGLFQSVWTISNTYMLLVLSSMSADYFPRLSTVSNDNTLVKKAIDEQTYVVINIITPILIAVVIFGKQILNILYSSEFVVIDGLLNVQLLGTFLKVASWPMAFILLAKGKRLLFIFSEISFFVVYLLLTYLLFPSMGLHATGVSYFLTYIYYFIIMVLYAKKLSNYLWNRQIVRIAIISSTFILAAYLVAFLQVLPRLSIGIVIVLISSYYSFSNLNKIINVRKWLAQFVNRMKSKN